MESLDVSATELERRKREVCHSLFNDPTFKKEGGHGGRQGVEERKGWGEDKGWTRVGGDFSRGLDMGVGKTREVRLGERRGWG